MKLKKLLGIFLAALMLLSLATPAFAAIIPGEGTQTAEAQNASVEAGSSPISLKGADGDSPFISFFKNILEKLKELWDRVVQAFKVKREKVKNTMNKNAIHMLKSVTDTIGDSFIITTEDGKVMVIDGGYRSETNYFIEYLRAVTGQKKPHIDAWFLSHPHDDHCEVFLEVVENRSGEVSFDKVYANFPEASFYDGVDEWAVTIISEFNRLKPRFEGKHEELSEGDVFNVGAAKFRVFYTFNPEWKSCNEASTIMRMDLGGTSVIFNGDAETNAGNYVVEKYGKTGLLDCDVCKMSHHGQGGVQQSFYQAVDPEVCLWPTPTWVYENTNGNLATFETRAWVDELGVKREYKSFEGSCVIYMKPRIVTTTDVFEDGYDALRAVDRLADLGYEGIDMGFDYWTFDGSPFLGDDYLDWARSLRARADERGIAYTHAHAPGEADSVDWVERSIRATAELGARYLVVHPIYKDSRGNGIKTKARFISINKKAIEQYLPLAEELGVVLLSENILWDASKNPKNVADLVKAVDSPYFGWCFDVGHAWACGYAPSILKKCSVAPLSIHVQDNDGSGDQHANLGHGTIDMDEFVSALKAVGYAGDCDLECHHESLYAPDEERDAILSELLESAKELREKMW